MRSVGKAVRLSLVVVCAFFALGASCRPDFPTDRPTIAEPEALVAKVKGPLAAMKTMRAVMRVDAYTKDGRFKVKQMVLVERPGRLHIATLSPMDSPLSVLVSNGKRFALYDQRDQKFYRGPSSPQNIAKLLPVYLTAEEIVALAFGEPPWGACAQGGGATRLFADREKGRYRIECGAKEGAPSRGGPSGAASVRDIVEVDPWRLVATEVRRFKADGAIEHRLRFSEHEQAGPAVTPRRIHYENKVHGVDVLIKVTEAEWNVELEAAVFELEPPRGVPIVTLP